MPASGPGIAPWSRDQTAAPVASERRIPVTQDAERERCKAHVHVLVPEVGRAAIRRVAGLSSRAESERRARHNRDSSRDVNLHLGLRRAGSSAVLKTAARPDAEFDIRSRSEER